MAGEPRQHRAAPRSQARPRSIVEVARETGVSKTTVSRVLNGSASVAPETRRRVLAAIADSGFQVNQAARSLRTSRTGLIGFLVPVISLFGHILEELDLRLAPEELGILLTSTRRRDPGRDLVALDTLVGRGVDALVAAPSDDRSAELARYLRNLRTPVVLLDREVDGVACDAVHVEHGEALRAAVEHLVAGGRSRLGLIALDGRTRPGRGIVSAFRAACATAGLAPSDFVVQEFTDLDAVAATTGVDEFVERKVDGIVATGTLALTGGILARLAQHGLRVPADVSLVDWDSGEPSPAASLPAIRYPVAGVAARVAELVLDRLAMPGAAPRTLVVTSSFTTGATLVPR